MSFVKHKNSTERLIRQSVESKEILLDELETPKFKAFIDLMAMGWKPLEISRVLCGETLGGGRLRRWTDEARRMLGKSKIVYTDSTDNES